MNNMNTNRGSVQRDKYNEVRSEVLKLTQEKAEIMDRWREDSAEKSEQLASARKEVERLAEKVKSSRSYHGRNKMTTKEFNRYEHANSEMIAKYTREQVFPHLKFLHKSWSAYLPLDPRSFYCKINVEVGLDAPPDVDPEIFWNESTVPLMNKKICETRSNVNTGHKNQYKGKVVPAECESD